jgi:hypothetical protein
MCFYKILKGIEIKFQFEKKKKEIIIVHYLLLYYSISFSPFNHFNKEI